MAQEVRGGKGVDILGTGIFETDGNAFSFPVLADTNYDSVQVGNDRALAFGMGDGWPFGLNGPASAVNNLEIKKNQDGGGCAPCELDCFDSCLQFNVEQIEVGNREALAFGSAMATNNIKIVTNQQGQPPIVE
jgi:hypothetical protein